MRRATLSSCSMRSRSPISCSRRCPRQFRAGRSYAPLLGDLAPRDAVDDDGLVGQLPAGRSNAHKLPSIVGGVHDEAGHHLVSLGYLILDDVAGR